MIKCTFFSSHQKVSTTPALGCAARFPRVRQGAGAERRRGVWPQRPRGGQPQAAGRRVCAPSHRHFCSRVGVPGCGGAAVRTRGRGGGGAGGGLRHRPPPPRPAPSGHCRISIVPRHNFAEAQRDPGARRRKYSPCRPAARAGGGGGGAGARGTARGCAGLPAPGGHARASAGGPGTRRNLPGSLRSWSGRGLGAAAPGRLSSPSPDPPPSRSALGEGACVPPLPGGQVRPRPLPPPRSRATSREPGPK